MTTKNTACEIRATMSKGRSYGGGQSSLDYLFGSGQPENPPSVSPPVTRTPRDDDSNTKRQPKTPSQNLGVSNNYHRAQGQNLGNFITDRPTTKVHSPPGGGSSLGHVSTKLSTGNVAVSACAVASLKTYK